MDRQLNLRVATKDLSRLEEVASKLEQFKKAAVARAAFRLGLEVLLAEPSRFVDAKAGGATP